jgi:hypothetical protein
MFPLPALDAALEWLCAGVLGVSLVGMLGLLPLLLHDITRRTQRPAGPRARA